MSSFQPRRSVTPTAQPLLHARGRRQGGRQVGRALAQLGIELIPAYSPEARGRSERMFGTLQKRLPQELRLAGITDMLLPQGGLPATTQRPLRPRPRTGAPPSSPSPARSTTSCASTRNAPSQTTTRQAPGTSDPRRPPPPPLRHSAFTNTPTAQWPSSMDRDVWRDTTPMANRSTAKPARPRDPLRRDRPAPCGQVDSRSATDHFPTGPETATEAVNSYGT